MNQETEQKLEKTIERIHKALEYNDQEYFIELIHDLTEFAYFSGYKEAGMESHPNPIKKKKNKHVFTMTPVSSGSIEEKIANLLLELGIPAHIKGFKYLIEAITVTYANPAIIGKITKEIYPMIANKFNTSSNRVERAIRHSLEVMWNRGNIGFLSVILGYPINIEKPKPANSTFIYQVAKYLINNPIQNELTTSITEQENLEK